ncbi:MAG: acetate/propionate family kinase [Eubacteriales bacterium]
MHVLVVNAGSSSLKYQLFETDTGDVLAKGNCERIGIDGLITHKVPSREDFKASIPMSTHTQAVQAMVDALVSPVHGVISSMDEISAVGHRIVHGGPYFTESLKVDDNVIENLEKCRDIAPLHTGPHLMGIKGCMSVMPATPQVVVFDTAFHQTMPEVAYTYPLPYEISDKYKIRRYGFHGTSHRYVSGKAIEALGKGAKGTRIVTCHIGNGSSISAVKDGKVLDTSMGFTPLEGVIMGSRCGAMDPAIVPFIMEKENIAPADMQKWMNQKCGFLGVSGVSSDLREIDAAIKAGNKRAALALDILAYQMKKYIGSYAAAMNGLDAIVFTAGVGENNSDLREMCLTDMDFLGIKLDTEANKQRCHGDYCTISAPDSKVKVYIIPTNEELVIAHDTAKIVGGK